MHKLLYVTVDSKDDLRLSKIMSSSVAAVLMISVTKQSCLRLSRAVKSTRRFNLVSDTSYDTLLTPKLRQDSRREHTGVGARAWAETERRGQESSLEPLVAAARSDCVAI